MKEETNSIPSEIKEILPFISVVIYCLNNPSVKFGVCINHSDDKVYNFVYLVNEEYSVARIIERDIQDYFKSFRGVKKDAKDYLINFNRYFIQIKGLDVIIKIMSYDNFLECYFRGVRITVIFFKFYSIFTILNGSDNFVVKFDYSI